MTRSIILTTTLVLIQLICYKNVKANKSSIPDGPSVHVTSSLPMPEKHSMDIPVMGVRPNIHKIHLMKIEELGKVHRFHKERVKKLNRNYNKYWVAAKILLVCCHIALLVHAFMHLSH